MSKPTRATKYIHEAAKRVRDGGITVDYDSAFETVAIDAPDQEGVFMQGHEAADFINEVEALCRRFPSLDSDTAALALAEPIAECIFN